MTFKKKYPLWLTLFGKHWFAAVLCLILNICLLISFGTRFGRTIAQFCSCAIYYALIYTTVRDRGENDCNEYLNGRGKKDLLKGLKSALIAASINILFSFAFVFLKVFSVEPGFLMFIYRFIINPFYMPINLTLMQTSLTIIEIPLANVLISACLNLAMPVVAALGYIVGFGQSTVSELIMYKTEQKPE